LAPGSNAGSRASAFCPLSASMPYMLTLPMSCRGKPQILRWLERKGNNYGSNSISGIAM